MRCVFFTNLDVFRLRVGILLYELLQVVERGGHLIFLQRQLLLLGLFFLDLVTAMSRKHALREGKCDRTGRHDRQVRIRQRGVHGTKKPCSGVAETVPFKLQSLQSLCLDCASSTYERTGAAGYF